MASKLGKLNLSKRSVSSPEMDVLFTSEESAEQGAGLELISLRITTIEADPSQPRQWLNDASLAELAESIKRNGVIQPIEVVQIGPQSYRIVHGERRWRASQLAQLATIPAIVRRSDYDDTTRFVRQLVENIQREDLNDIDRAAGLVKLRELLQAQWQQSETVQGEPWGTKVTWAKVGEELGYSRQRVHQLIKLLDLPEEVRESVQKGELKERDTRLYQGLNKRQIGALHRARMGGAVTHAEAAQAASHLKEGRVEGVQAAIDLVQGRGVLPPPPSAELSPPPTPVYRSKMFHVAHQQLLELDVRTISAEQSPALISELQNLQKEITRLIKALQKSTP